MPSRIITVDYIKHLKPYYILIIVFGSVKSSVVLAFSNRCQKSVAVQGGSCEWVLIGVG